VPVEVRTAERRVFRLSREVGDGGVRLVLPAPFEPGRPVEIRFRLPGSEIPFVVQARVGATREEQEGEQGGCALDFLDPPPEVRTAIAAYVAERLGLPPLPLSV
jgi:hypothetical protein